jgi:multicomponent Na+:H+ antiporter subunit D
LVETTQILLATFAGFWLLRNKLAGEALISLDTDWFYRRSARIAKKLFVDTVDNAFKLADRLTDMFASALAEIARNPLYFSVKKGEDDYDPDRYRPSTKLLVSGILFSFLILTLSAFFAVGAF